MNNEIPKIRAILAYILAACFLFFEMAVQVSPSVMTHELMHDLHIHTALLGLMSGFYFYSYTCMQIPSGILFDRYHPRDILCGAIFLCAAGCLILSAASTVYGGIAGRLIMGTGSAFAFVAVLVVTADVFPAKHFAWITGMTQLLAALGAMSGQMPLSRIVSVIGWRHTMHALSFIGCILMIFVWILLNYRKQPILKKKQVQYHCGHLFLNPQTWIVGFYACMLWAPMSGFASLWGISFLEQAHHLTHAEAAWLSSMMWLGLAIASPILGYLSTVFHSRKWALAWSALLGVIGFGFLLTPLHNTTLLTILLLCCGASCAGQALSFSVVKENNNPKQQGSAIAINNMAVVVSGAVFQPFLGWMLQGSTHNTHQLIGSMQYVWLAYVLGFILAVFFIRDSYPSEPPHHASHGSVNSH